MNNDVRCPYCNKWQEIDHDDGCGYDEDVLHEQECSDCEKTFTFYTRISYHYEAFTADCLNEGGEHDFNPTRTYPKEMTRMRCSMCEKERCLTADEFKTIMEGNPCQ